MKIELSKLYYYVFNSGADIEKRLENVPFEHKEARRAKIKKEIKDFFRSQLENTMLASQLCRVIQSTLLQKNPHLVKVLFDDWTREKVLGCYFYDDDLDLCGLEKKRLDKMFDDLEEEYGLLQDERKIILPQTRSMFYAYYNICHLVAVLFE